MFLIMMMLSMIFACVYTGGRWVAFSNMSWPVRIIVMSIIFLVFVSPFFFRILGTSLTGTHERLLINTLMFVVITAFFLFLLMLVRDVFWFPLSWIWPDTFMPTNAAHVMRSNWLMLLLALGTSIFSLFCGLQPPRIQNTTLSSNKITTPLKIAVLSDLHIDQSVPLNEIKYIVDAVNNEKPDVVLILGDVWDDTTTKMKPYETVLKKISAPVFAIEGNHEFYHGYDQAVELFKRIGATYLFNDGVRLTPSIYLGGIPDHHAVTQFSQNTANLSTTFEQSQTNDYRILMSHQPLFFDTARDYVDLQLSGHTHGGHLFPLHIIIKLTNHYLSGLYQHGNAYLYVNPGTRQWGPIMRLLSHKEITVISLIPESDTQK